MSTPGFIGKAPEAVGVNQLVGESATPAFHYWRDNWSDIQDHIEFMFGLAKGDILDLGTRGGVATSAFLAGVEAMGGHVTSLDINPLCKETFAGHPQWTFINQSSINADPINAGPFDLIFIDTEHTSDQLRREFQIWTPRLKPGGIILVHDVITFREMEQAIFDFLHRLNMEYRVREGSNGLGVLTPKEGV